MRKYRIYMLAALIGCFAVSWFGIVGLKLLERGYSVAISNVAVSQVEDSSAAYQQVQAFAVGYRFWANALSVTIYSALLGCLGLGTYGFIKEWRMRYGRK